jgi:hypothetical protein
MDNLPIFAAYLHSLSSTLFNLPIAFKISWPWMLALLPVNILHSIYLMLNMPAPGTVVFQKPIGPIVATVILFLVSFVAFASIAVNWHRYLLLDEVPRGWIKLRVDGIVVRYIGNAIGIAILSILFAIFIMIGPAFLSYGLSKIGGMVGVTIAIALLVCAFTLVLGMILRMNLKLPGVAIANKKFNMSNALDQSVGNTWRCGLYGLLIYLSMAAVGFVFGYVTVAFGNVLSMLALSTLVVLQLAFNWLATIWNISALSVLYGYFVEGRSLQNSLASSAIP